MRPIEDKNWRTGAKLRRDWDLEVVKRTPGVQGFAVFPKRWIVERTDLLDFSVPSVAVKDYERKVQMSEALIEAAMIRRLFARQGRRD